MTSQPVSKKSKIGGLDSIRFFAALWVVFNHRGAPPLLDGADRGHGLMQALGFIYDASFNGQAGVILFFIISGFCIHYPQTRGRRLDIPSFYARRLLRIAIPWAVVDCYIRLSAARPVLGPFFHIISWTLQCEIAYYILYPLLLQIAKKTGWMKMFAAAYALSFLLIALLLPHAQLCGTGKLLLNGIIGLPSWLLGCLLAEDFAKSNATGIPRIWLWRAGVWLAATASYALMQHTPVGMPWSLNCFAVLGYFYIRAELAYYQTRKPMRLFEMAGAASYSIYLTHLVVVYYLLDFEKTHSAWAHWVLLSGAIFVVACIYYRLVELPSHQLARKFRAPGPLRTLAGGTADAG